MKDFLDELKYILGKVLTFTICIAGIYFTISLIF